MNRREFFRTPVALALAPVALSIPLPEIAEPEAMPVMSTAPGLSYTYEVLMRHGNAILKGCKPRPKG